MQTLNHDSLDKLAKLQGVGEANIIVQLVDLFKKNSAELLQAIELAAMTGDSEQVSRSAHSLKSSSGTVGAEIMVQLCLDLETNSQNPLLVSELVLSLKSEVLHVQSALNEYIRLKSLS